MGRTNKPVYSLDREGRCIIEHYNEAKPFSNFFPGIAGVWGTPMWVFYVNRGQCIASLGTGSKDKSFMEFQPANKSYRLTTLQGFRSFLKVRYATKTVYWEPFQNNLPGTDFHKKQCLRVSAHDLTLTESNDDLGLEVEVNYFTMPEEPYSALVRTLIIRNLGKRSCAIQLLDGLPMIVPYGMKDWLLKNMSRTAEAWVKVGNIRKKAPYYHLNVEIADTPQVIPIEEGNFFFSFYRDGKDAVLLNPIVEADSVFGPALDFSAPVAFLTNGIKPRYLQKTANRTPSAFGYGTFMVAPGRPQEIVSLFGYIHHVNSLNGIVRQVTRQDGFIAQKATRSKEIIDDIRQHTWTHSSSCTFDLYAGHTFLDNILRGGLPVSINTADGSIALNVYSRKHGDLERDYNHFMVAPTFYSQGNGNYRDVNQNRRNDLWFNTDVRDSHLVAFLNLVQADGYNPLVIKGTMFHVEGGLGLNDLLNKFVSIDSRAALRDFLEKSFSIGGLFRFMDRQAVVLTVERKVFLEQLLLICHHQEIAEHGEGFWTDHWTYNLDCIESYLAFYPQDARSLLLERKVFSFYQNTHYVLPRAQRYILTEHGVRQYHAVAKDGRHEAMIARGDTLRSEHGQGDIYYTYLLSKLLCLVANKVASLDPSGVGIEMEADKPNWYDALNGLPGLLGSSICETFELKRLCRFIGDILKNSSVADSEQILIFEELLDFLSGLELLLAANPQPLDYWFKSNDLKERYRAQVRSGIKGTEKPLSLAKVKDFLNLVIDKADQGIALASDAQGRLATYFYHEVTEYQNQENSQHILPLQFKRHTLPPFLEGYVHAFRVEDDASRLCSLYREIRRSSLFDKTLKMYRVNADLSAEPESIGRTRIFPAGWLENASIWLHMEYKFLLELLRCGLYDEFFDNFKNVLIPFQDPQRYGRSILENSSFLVSSIHEDQLLHGQGFVARLSGSTAEFLHMWLWMNIGKTPFVIGPEGALWLQFQPILPGWLFTRKATKVHLNNLAGQTKAIDLPAHVYAFKFLSTILVVYHNLKHRDTYKAKIAAIHLTYPQAPEPIVLTSSFIPPPHSHAIREKKVERIDIFLE